MPKIIQCKVLEVIQRTPDVKSFRIVPLETVDYEAGQFMKVTIDIDGTAETKYFTISNSPTIKEYIEFTKKLTDSSFSKALNNLNPGDELTIQAPMGRFTLSRAGGKIAFISGGIGITPIFSICQFMYDTELRKDVVLIYGNHQQQDIAFKDELDQMAEECEGFRIVHVLDNPQNEWQGYSGFITKDVVMNEIPDYRERVFFLCGPPKMVESLKTMLMDEMSISSDRVIIENFTGY